MTKTEIQNQIKFLEEHKIPYAIIGDNMQRYEIGEGTMLVWDKSGTTASCVRINVGQNQTAKPYQVRSFCLDHIESVEINTGNIEDVLGFVKASTNNAAGAQIAADAIEEYANRTIGISTNQSTGDGYDWEKSNRVHVKPYKNFSAAGSSIYGLPKEDESDDNDSTTGD